MNMNNEYSNNVWAQVERMLYFRLAKSSHIPALYFLHCTRMYISRYTVHYTVYTVQCTLYLHRLKTFCPIYNFFMMTLDYSLPFFYSVLYSVFIFLQQIAVKATGIDRKNAAD